MKKFFLSVAVMLAAVSINANAMSDSSLFYMSQGTFIQHWVADQNFRSQVMQEISRLKAEAQTEFDEDNEDMQTLNTVQAGTVTNTYALIEALHNLKKSSDGTSCKGGFLDFSDDADADTDASQCKQGYLDLSNEDESKRLTIWW